MSRCLRNRRRFCLPLHRFPACLAGWHSRQGSSISGSVPHPPSCPPFAPSPLRDFLATPGALTPAGHSPTLGQVSLIHASGRLIILSPTPLGLPPSLSHPTPQRVGLLTRVSPGFATESQARQLSGRIAFVILRTDRSPPAAPHPASRTDAVAVGYRPERACLKRTSTSLTKCAFRRTIPAFAGMTNMTIVSTHRHSGQAQRDPESSPGAVGNEG